jgi:thiamine pyrophosphokinase
VIFANGILPDVEAARRLLAPGDMVLCADGGARHARALGITPHALIGDLDSIARDDLSEFAEAGVPVTRHSHDKDETDLELALEHALEQDPASIVIVGALGARLDHTLGNIGLLLDHRLAGRDCCLDDGIERVLFCRARAEIRGAPGDLVSLLPWGGPASGVRTSGLRWPLHAETLLPERSRGISNQLLEKAGTVELDAGLLLIIHRRGGPDSGSHM